MEYKKTNVTIEELEPILLGLDKALSGNSRTTALTALLTMCFIVLKPNIEPELLKKGVQDASEYMCLLIESASESKPAN